MTNMTLKQLRYFEAVARHGHFGRAASACAISQPALSVQIRDLEEDLGAQLFERSARQIRLTQFGEDILSRVRGILSGVEELQDYARAARESPLSRLRLGIIPTIAPYLLPRIIGHLSARHAAIDLQVRETLTSRLIEELQARRIDAAIVALPISEPELAEVPLFDEDFVLVRPLADAGKPVPDGETLSRMRLLLLEEGHCFRDQALSFCSLQPGAPRDGLDGSSLTTLVQMVAAGIGVTLIPDMAVGVEAKGAAVDVARFARPVPRRSVGMVWRKASPLQESFAEIAETVREAAATER
ncbi:LysR substrate-binding domain-containing protein [Ponticoccus sp. (in: a-proteobacteria)]|uniref:hydrogen peroxide-inducible genes activator n=1 Tax=Ponticoccus sp. (in: a-proteobacteria) TaxID=1925025 RepID=UPI003AB8075E